MKLEEITTAVIEETVSAWRYGQQIPSALNDLAALNKIGGSPDGKEQTLRDFITGLVENQVQQQRDVAGISSKPIIESDKSVKTALQADFQSKHKPLTGWSAFYFRYLSPMALSVAELAAAVPLSTRQFRRYVNQGVEQLTHLIRQEEQAAQKQYRRLRLQRFIPPPDFIRLFGMEEIVGDVVTRLTKADGPRFVSIEGLGGSGKTAVAQTVAYQLAGHDSWQGILWLSAKQERLTSQWQLEKIDNPARSLEDIVTRLCHQVGQENLAGLPVNDKLNGLKPILSTQPHLIVIDNLETLSDTQALLPALFPLAGLSRFLLTSRHSLRDVGFVHVLPLPQLSERASQALIESELARHGKAITLSPTIMASIYQALGGLPLALKLLAAQLGEFPLQHLLDGLKSARRQGPERLYSFIYRHTWRLLSASARRLLLTMLLVSPDGEDVSWMKLMSNLPTADFDDALIQLRRYSLLETAGSLTAPRYRLHRLTTTFLQTEVLLQWREDADTPPYPSDD